MKPIEHAIYVCILGSNSAADVGDDGMSLEIHGSPRFVTSSGVSYTDTKCVLDDLDVPDYVHSQMGNTRALDGMQSAEWDTFKVTWTYHPDDGLDLVIVDKGE